MKRFIRNIAIAIMCCTLAVPATDAQGRRNNNGNRTENNGQRPGASRPGQRPGANGGSHNNSNNNQRPQTPPQSGGNNNHRPGNSGSNNNQRPNGNNHPGGNNNYRPGGNGNNRPQTPPPANNHRPGNGGHWGNNHHHNTPPPPPPSNHHYGHHYNRPPHHHPPYYRPVPPPTFRPGRYYPSFNTILGIAIGTAFNASISQFYNNGYTIDGYSNNQVYLRNVSQMNYNWPEAVMYYNNGYLSGSQFMYATSYNNADRYFNLYNQFCRQYGAPVSVQNGGTSMEATWFGYDNRYVTIRYNMGYNEWGSPCYYTTLSFGN